MADVMAIVSKAIFEKSAGKSPQLGAKLGMDRYVTANKTFEKLEGGGKIYLVTVRPPNEALWLVAVIDNPRFDGTQWLGKPSTTGLTDISSLRSMLKFESGKGITAAAGALGMSLQTPRALAAADSQMLDALAGGAKAGPVASPAPVSAPSVSAADARRSELVAAIVGDPDHDLTRQVYADELGSNNDPRGELILVELALDRPVSIRKRELLVARRKELYKAHGKAWFPYKLGFRTRGGFIHAITGTLAQVTTAAPKLFATEPVVEVIVTAVENKQAAKLAKASWLTNLRSLAVRGTIGDDGFAALCTSKGTDKLRSLNVTANHVSGEALEAMGDHFPELVTLVLTANPIGDDGITALRSWKHLGQIETLYLSKCELTVDGVTALLAGPLPCLRKLTLSGNDLDDAVVAAIVKRAGALPALRRLELTSTELTLAGATVLATKLPNVTRIDARKTDIDSDDAESLDPRVRVR